MDLFARASRDSLLLRFFTPVRQVDPHLVELLAASDGEERMAYVVTRGAGDDEQLVAVGNYVRLPRRDAAEIAFFVDDPEQGKGLGTLLLERLAQHARDQGIVTLIADVLTVNERMLQVFRDSGLATEVHAEGDTFHVTLAARASESAVARSDDRERVATVASLAPLLRPRSVAVAGASRDRRSVGRMVFEALLRGEFEGPVYPVNPAARAIGSVRAYRSVLDVPDDVDLAVVAVPTEHVLDVVEDCARKRIRALVVLSAGFAELGPAGKALQDELAFRARSQGMRLVGPNCIGLVNTAPAVRLNASFSPVFPPQGKVAIASQSGALGVAVLDFAGAYGLGVSTFVSVGNKADVSGNDLLQYWHNDPDTAVILLYLESFGNARKFARIARAVAREKPILALKAGRTAAGSKAARSHTAALASDERSVAALFHQAGIIRADNLEELFDVAALLANQPLPPGRRVGIVTNAGGPAILCADSCAAQGLELGSLDGQTVAGLAKVLPSAAALGNPIDMIASASAGQYAEAIRLVLRDPGIDALIAIHTPVGLVEPEAVAAAIRDAATAARGDGAAEKPVLACFTTAQSVGPPAPTRTELQNPPDTEFIPTFRFPEPPARALALAAAYAEWRRNPLGAVPALARVDTSAARAVIDGLVPDGVDRWLDAGECARLFGAAGIEMVSTRLANDADEAAGAAEALGFPVALKIRSTRFLHKSDVGGVILGLDSAKAVRAAADALQRRLGADLGGLLVQPMVRGGVEVLVGVTTDPDFGPLIGFGLGGTAAELLNDVVFRITPLTDLDAREMVGAIRGASLLQGYRGQPPVDREALQELLLRVSWLVETVPEIVELDLNPVMASGTGSGAIPLDARIRIRRTSSRATVSGIAVQPDRS
jgi:acetyl coenzyme A synthetase (ADP forming)-like protein